MLGLSSASILLKITFLNYTEAVLFPITISLLDVIHILMSIDIHTPKIPDVLSRVTSYIALKLFNFLQLLHFQI